MKKILVTGANGFIGSHLTEELVKRGYQVKAFTFHHSFDAMGRLDNLPTDIKEEIELVTGNIRDPNSVRSAMEGIDSVFHLASLTSVSFSCQSPDSFVDTNIKGTLNVLQAAKSLKTEKTMIVSASDVYGNADYIPINELHPRKSQSPYAATKIGAECLAESFFQCFSLPVVIVRPFHTYGPKQSARAIIPSIISRLLAGVEEIKLEDINATMDFTYIKDTVNALLEIEKSQKTSGETINIASQKEVSIKDLAEELILRISPKAKIIENAKTETKENKEILRNSGSNQKLMELTEWKPEYPLSLGLTKTINWMRKNPGMYKKEV